MTELVLKHLLWRGTFVAEAAGLSPRWGTFVSEAGKFVAETRQFCRGGLTVLSRRRGGFVAEAGKICHGATAMSEGLYACNKPG